MNELQKLIQGKEHYPPSFELWRSLINSIKGNRKDPEKERRQIQEQMMREVAKYKPSLPEPETVRFRYDDVFYYLDGKNNIYKIDESSAIVGNLVGKIEGTKIIIDGICVYEMDKVEVSPKIIHDRHFYVDTHKNVYKGFHETSKIICQVGKMDGDKIKIEK